MKTDWIILQRMGGDNFMFYSTCGDMDHARSLVRDFKGYRNLDDVKVLELDLDTMTILEHKFPPGEFDNE